MRVLVTGSRDWRDDHQIHHVFQQLYDRYHHHVTIVSGACPTGADALCEQAAAHFQFAVERHPADWETFGKRAGPKRNTDMVAQGADVCLAFPTASSRGTRHCISQARAYDIPVWEFTEAR